MTGQPSPGEVGDTLRRAGFGAATQILNPDRGTPYVVPLPGYRVTTNPETGLPDVYVCPQTGSCANPADTAEVAEWAAQTLHRYAVPLREAGWIVSVRPWKLTVMTPSHPHALEPGNRTS